MAHVWGAGVVSINLVFLVEWLMGLPALSLAPVLAVANGMLFVVKAGFLSGEFYAYAALVFAAIPPMVYLPGWAPLILGTASAFGFFATGLKYYLRGIRARRSAPEAEAQALLKGP